MMLLSSGCYDPKDPSKDGPSHSCPFKYSRMVDAIKRAHQENVTKIACFDANGGEWEKIRNRNEHLKDNTPFDFKDDKAWKS